MSNPSAGRVRAAIFVAVHSALGVGLAGAAAYVTGAPCVFPSLGASALVFYASAGTPAARPRNALIGHAIGILAGFAALQVAGAVGAPALGALDMAHVVSATLSIALTGAVMALLDVVHPPAGATTLIVALGFISRPRDLVVMMTSLALLTGLATLTNHLRAGPSRAGSAGTGSAGAGTGRAAARAGA